MIKLKKLILIKHSIPTISSEIPSNKWTLSEEGIQKANLFVLNLEKYNFKRIFSSDEPKAIETANIFGGKLNKEVEIIKGIHEHERNSNRVIYPKEQWEELMRSFFEFPNKLIFGDETATEARIRFRTSILKLVSANPPDEDIVVVTHGTVMSLFISEYNEVDIFKVWNSFGLPSYAELNADSFILNDIFNNIIDL